MVGDRWTLLVLREAFYGVRRYGEMVRNLGIARNELAARLKALVGGGCSSASGTGRIPTGTRTHARVVCAACGADAPPHVS